MSLLSQLYTHPDIEHRAELVLCTKPGLAYKSLDELVAAEGSINWPLDANKLVYRQETADQNSAPARDRDERGSVKGMT